MDTSKPNSSQGYGKPPWVFKGSALYQLHLVKAETARAFIPKDFRLVEAFGYTLGGFFLANYEDSPVGIFDELVVIAGIVWNPPTSCAWAARVLVNSDQAFLHGRKDVGLPSRVANFTKSAREIPGTKRSRFGGFLNKIGMSDSMKSCLDVQIKEMNNHTAMDLCSINLTTAATAPSSQNDAGRWMGPAIKMSLPSFSGRTEHNPHLLKYSCQIECSVTS
ncbi:protein NEOXANTHIN-DEFICIENT 1 isoform X2 [Salvia miltiorrhiza]|uniref:protein NEOXANTHIN-DEFICIENT 1 isoform X2 n=1 Tax=Salvia miltiorrhiza TaxID=226208 RepID=UPI0025AD09C6|nr:protein NEOXANTHIN-DEFICIENT 1 isoform X2 [Salvia miltiorrhiza]XP_057773868.1 protein NEOXANTHIN-DEFICIENT 1 isoform X2 [Salvia miltiorrhiza]XP_057773869.1 protein NEOXANTHIN-DEFICIENT 1 isoform X2 [Salvia miltiorrhiza]